MSSQQVTGIDVGNVTAWFADHTEITEPLQFDLVAHGRSNLTFVVSDAEGRRWVLRRPPTGHVLRGAHDMGREYTLIAALADTPVPVPGAVGMCDDEAVNGAPFYVMEHVDGHILKKIDDMGPFDEAACRTMSESLVDTLVALHDVDPDAVGLGEFAKKDDYLARQLHVWKRQIDKGSDRDLPLLHDLHARFQRSMPAQHGAGIVHGDFRLDNCMIGADNRVAAVLDWELCTLGDVRADLAGMIMWWGDPTGVSRAMADAPTLAPGMLTPDEVIERYATASGRDVEHLDYFVAFQFWRLAAISEGVRFRFAQGAMGDKDIGDEMAGFETRIELLLAEADRRLD
jgi:aminoglycoside phosphotransferase (APT) family kinase protein